jgi:hypothetical protein
MRVKNTTGVDVVVMAVGEIVDQGATVEVDDELGAQLVAQGWAPAAAGPSKGDLFAQAVELGIDAKKSWGVQRLQDTIDAATAAGDPEPAVPGDSTPEADPAAPQED